MYRVLLFYNRVCIDIHENTTFSFIVFRTLVYLYTGRRVEHTYITHTRTVTEH